MTKTFYILHIVKKISTSPPHHFSNVKLKVPSSLLFQNLCNEPGFKIKTGPLKSSAIHRFSRCLHIVSLVCICYDMLDQILYDTKVENSFSRYNKTTLLDVYKRSLSYTCRFILCLENVGKLDINIYSN